MKKKEKKAVNAKKKSKKSEKTKAQNNPKKINDKDNLADIIKSANNKKINKKDSSNEEDFSDFDNFSESSVASPVSRSLGEEITPALPVTRANRQVGDAVVSTTNEVGRYETRTARGERSTENAGGEGREVTYRTTSQNYVTYNAPAYIGEEQMRSAARQGEERVVRQALRPTGFSEATFTSARRGQAIRTELDDLGASRGSQGQGGGRRQGGEYTVQGENIADREMSEGGGLPFRRKDRNYEIK